MITGEVQMFWKQEEKSACGVGFVASKKGLYSHDHLQQTLHALRCVEHRGACSADEITGDGSGIMTDIPFDLFGFKPNTIAVATLFIPTHPERQRISLKVFEDTFAFLGMEVLSYRNVPIDESVLGDDARETVPVIKQAFIQRPAHCRTDFSFDKLLYMAKQLTRTKEREAGIVKEFFFASLSSTTIVYKALTRAVDLDRFYLDLQNPDFKTRFALFHRRFSTNTRTSWDKVQPFRMIGHNGEINTIAGNRSWGFSRERSLGLVRNELLTRTGISDTGSLNEMVEALMFRSSIQHIEDITSILIPPAGKENAFYKFWSRAMEPWDGPAFVNFCDGQTIGARLDRNGFRPCRWAMTDDHFYLSSEAGSFAIAESKILAKGSLSAGTGVKVDLRSGNVSFTDPSQSRDNYDAGFDPRLVKLNPVYIDTELKHLNKATLFQYTDEDFKRILDPMIEEGKEPIGSMGDTARPAILSDMPRPFFDYFYQNFAQVTNPPLDYLREKMVTDLSTYLGRRPNIFSPKELIPPAIAIELESPVLSLAQFQFIEKLKSQSVSRSRVVPREFSMTFDRADGAVGFKSAIKNIAKDAANAVKEGASVLILTDRDASYEHPPIPSLLVLRAVVNSLNELGLRLEAATLVHTAEVRSTHQLAALISFGATAVCPYMALEIARSGGNEKLPANQRERNLVKAFEQGLLKIMSKSGISVARSYHSAKMFTAIGLGNEIIDIYFPGLGSPIGGIGINELVEQILTHTALAGDADHNGKPIKTYQFKEHNKGTEGERHSMTNTRSKMIHELVRETGHGLDKMELYESYLQSNHQDSPVNLRHLLQLKKANMPADLDDVQPASEILRTFGSGAMSFGAISAESQRDIFEAMREIGGRSNSGEGGENPYYFTDGITASTKQVASGRFGVTAQYLITGDEIQIKVAQGAKPGEGGQLMGVKVNEDIARARHSLPNVDLISPPPLHDIYSIEDLKQLIYELKQIKPGVKVCVKLVSGSNIGTIAVGVAKAGADIIHISGADGGTGAASLSSMKHAGLPWELGLVEAHRALLENDLRERVILRTDGGLQTGTDIVMAALLGADEFDFGKLLLVAQGCVMARICEKNTCPTGIATHDPKFKAKYKGTKEDVIKMLQYIADDVRRQLAHIGERSLADIIGRSDLLEVNARHIDLINRRKIDLSQLLGSESVKPIGERIQSTSNDIGELNRTIIADSKSALDANKDAHLNYSIRTVDRAVLATLSGNIAIRRHEARIQARLKNKDDYKDPFTSTLQIRFTGSAGQGFGAFLESGINVKLYGEANDSVGKSMSGGMIVIQPREESVFRAEENAILGNCAIYGATGGTLYVNGLAGDRFAVRNSGATAVVEGTGLHACEYMTNGRVVILGKTSANIGAGMTGGCLYVYGDAGENINTEYIASVALSDQDYSELKVLLEDYLNETGSNTSFSILTDWESRKKQFVKWVPKRILEFVDLESNPEEMKVKK